MIHNVNCARRSDLVRDARVFHPYRQQPRAKLSPKQSLQALREAWGIGADKRPGYGRLSK